MAFEIPLLTPQVIMGLVEKFVAPENLVMLKGAPRQPWPFPSAQWDVIRGSRAIARPNVPNSEAHIVPRLSRSQESAAFIYLREKKVFSPTTLHWLRQPGEIAKTNAEMAVMREVADLNVRFDNFAEYCIWKMFSGTLTLDFPDVQATVNYQLPASHQPAPAVSWATATPPQIVNDIRAWKRLVHRDGRVPAKQAFATEVTVQYIFDSFAKNTSGVGSLLSDRMRDQYYTSGMIPGFMGLDWTIVEHVYDATGAAYSSSPTDPGNETLFLADGALLLGNFTDNRPWMLMEGPTADDDAPNNFTGKFTKTIKEFDPSARQYLMEWNLLPILERPEQIVFVDSVTSTTPGPG